MTLDEIIREEEQKKQDTIERQKAEQAHAAEHRRRFEETVELRLKSLSRALAMFSEAAKARGVEVWQNTEFLASLDETFKGTTLKIVRDGEEEVVIITCSQVEDQIVYSAEVLQLKRTWLLRRLQLGNGLAYERCENSERLLRFLTARYLV